MTVLDALAIPSKRNVKGLTTTIDALQSGDEVTAAFSTPRYGVVTIAGRAHFSKTTNSYMLAGRAVDANLKPDKSLQMLEIIDPQATLGAELGFGAGTVDGQGEDAGGEPAEIVPVLAHGDIVTARFFEPAYGAFSMTGACVSAPGGSLMLGTWFLSRNGVPSARLISIELRARAGEHSIRIPGQITSWGDESGAEGL